MILIGRGLDLTRDRERDQLERKARERIIRCAVVRVREKRGSGRKEAEARHRGREGQRSESEVDRSEPKCYNREAESRKRSERRGKDAGKSVKEALQE